MFLLKYGTTGMSRSGRRICVKGSRRKPPNPHAVKSCGFARSEQNGAYDLLHIETGSFRYCFRGREQCFRPFTVVNLLHIARNLIRGRVTTYTYLSKKEKRGASCWWQPLHGEAYRV
jgi:hypothetical protein